MMACSGLIGDIIIHALNDQQAKQEIHAWSIGRSPTARQADKLHPLRLKSTLCYPNPCRWSAATTAEP